MTDCDLRVRVANPKRKNRFPKGQIVIFDFGLPIRNVRIAFRNDGSRSSISGCQSETQELLSEMTERNLRVRIANPKCKNGFPKGRIAIFPFGLLIRKRESRSSLSRHRLGTSGVHPKKYFRNGNALGLW